MLSPMQQVASRVDVVKKHSGIRKGTLTRGKAFFRGTDNPTREKTEKEDDKVSKETAKNAAKKQGSL